MDYWNHTLESSLASPHVKRQIQYGQTHDRIEDSLTFEKEDYFQDFFPFPEHMLNVLFSMALLCTTSTIHILALTLLYELEHERGTSTY